MGLDWKWRIEAVFVQVFRWSDTTDYLLRSTLSGETTADSLLRSTLSVETTAEHLLTIICALTIYCSSFCLARLQLTLYCTPLFVCHDYIHYVPLYLAILQPTSQCCTIDKATRYSVSGS
jgi:hypothetical protein